MTRLVSILNRILGPVGRASRVIGVCALFLMGWACGALAPCRVDMHTFAEACRAMFYVVLAFGIPALGVGLLWKGALKWPS